MHQKAEHSAAMLDLTLHSNPVPVVEGRDMQTPESALQQLLQQHGAKQQPLAAPILQPSGVQAPAATANEQQNSPGAADSGRKHGGSRNSGRRHGRRPSRWQDDDEAQASTSDSDAEHWSMSPIALQRCARVLPAWHLP